MIRKTWLSVRGLLNLNPHMFDDLQTPEGVDNETVIANILLECAELECLFPDADFMQEAIKHWSKMCLPVWEHLKETTEYEYNPIWNKDGEVVETAEGNGIHATKGYNSDTWTDSDKNDTSGTVRRRETGNIGVTTTQTMIREERDIAEFNIVARIVDDFKKRFCLLIY